jgi:hypothetical protein
MGFISFLNANTTVGARVLSVTRTSALTAQKRPIHSNFTKSNRLMFSLPTCQPAKKSDSINHCGIHARTRTHTRTFQSTRSHKTHNIYLNSTKELVSDKNIRALNSSLGTSHFICDFNVLQLFTFKAIWREDVLFLVYFAVTSGTGCFCSHLGRIKRRRNAPFDALPAFVVRHVSVNKQWRQLDS